MEIERKFLIKTLPILDNFTSYEVEQFYLSDKPEIRIRRVKGKKSDAVYFLTFKSDGDLERNEVEIDINKTIYNSLIEMSNKINSISKTRYLINENGYNFELDIYNLLEGLVTVEIEFNNLKDAESFNIPNWFGREVTHNKRYKNKNLATLGIDNIYCKACNVWFTSEDAYINHVY